MTTGYLLARKLAIPPRTQESLILGRSKHHINNIIDDIKDNIIEYIQSSKKIEIKK